MMLPRDRVAAALSGDDADRVPYQDAFWSTTVQRWRAEGLPADSSPHDYFGCEIARLGGDYTLQASVYLMAVGLFTLGSGFSASALGYAGHFLLAAGLGGLVIIAALFWRPPPQRLG